MGVESVGLEAASYGPTPFAHLTDHSNRLSQGLFAEVLESKGLKFWAAANRRGPYALGAAPMATQAGERSKSEGIHSTSQVSSGTFRLGGASSLPSTDVGCLDRTVSISQLLAFRSKGGRYNDNQSPAVLNNSVPAMSSLSDVNYSCGGTTINSSIHPAYIAFSNTFPTVVNTSPHLVSDGCGSSAAVCKDPNYVTSTFAGLTTGSKPSSSGSSSTPFVFNAGASVSGVMKLEIQTNALPGHVSSGSCILPAKSTILTNDLLFGRNTPGIQPNVPVDRPDRPPMRPCVYEGSSIDTFVGSSEVSGQSNFSSNSSSAVPAWPVSQITSSRDPSYLGLSKSDSQFEHAFDVQNGGAFKPTGQSDFPYKDLLTANIAPDLVKELMVSTSLCSNFAEKNVCVSVNISPKPNQFDSDEGVQLVPEFGKLNICEDGEGIVKVNAFAEVERSLKNFDIDKEVSLRLKLENLALSGERNDLFAEKRTFLFGGSSTVAAGVRIPGSGTFVFGAATTPAGILSGWEENQCSEAPKISSALKFSPNGDVKPSVRKKNKFQHRPPKPGLRSCIRGRRRANRSSTGKSEVVLPNPSGDGVLMDILPQSPSGVPTRIQSNSCGLVNSLVPESINREGDERRGGAFDMNPMTELEISILKLRAAVSELNFGPIYGRTEETSTVFSNVKEQGSCFIGTKNCEDESNSTTNGHGLKRALVGGTHFVKKAEEENLAEQEKDCAGHSCAVNVLNVFSDSNVVRSNKLGADRNDVGFKTCSVFESSNYNDAGEHRAEDEEKGRPFTFTASPTGMSTSSLRRRTRKLLRIMGRSKQADRAHVADLQPDENIRKPMSTMKCGAGSGSAFFGGTGRISYHELNAQGGGGGGAAEQVCERWRLRGNEAYAKGDFAKAEEFYSLGAGSVSPHETSESCMRASMLCYSNRAATRMVVGRMREALVDCKHAMAVDPSFIRVRLRAAGCHLALGETELAESAFKVCLRQVQEASKLDCKVLADASDGLKKAQRVAEYCNQARKLVHNNSLTDSVTALRLINEALLASPQSEWLLELKAYTLISLQRYSEAVQVCEQSLALAERNFTTFEGASNGLEKSSLGWRRRITVKACFHLGKLEEALEQMEQLQDPLHMFSSDPDLPGALSAEMTLHSVALIRDLLRHKLEGNRAFQGGKFTEALEQYSAALARSGESRPFCAVCLCNRAAAFQALGHIADAIADCSRAIALDPLYAKAISRRASLYGKVRDHGQSCSDLGKLIAILERQHTQLQGISLSRINGSTRSTSSSAEELQQAKDRLAKAEDEFKKGLPLDHYCILGLELGCSASDVKKAYRKAALRHHPDKAGQFLLRSGDTLDDPLKDAMDETVRRDEDQLIDEVRKDSEQLFKLIGEAYAVLSDPTRRSRYDSEEDFRKLRSRSCELAKNASSDRKHAGMNDGTNVGQSKGGWSSCSPAGESGSQSRASRQRERWEGFNYQYQRWHPGPDAAQPDVYARRGRPMGSTFSPSQRSTSWRWEEYPWDDV